MSEQEATNLGNTIRQARNNKHLSTRELAELAGVSKAMIVRIENGDQVSPKPQALEGIAKALDLPISDLYTLANYKPAEGLPTFTPYLRTKYGALPAEAIAELQGDFERIARRYGYDGNGPRNGEDET